MIGMKWRPTVFRCPKTPKTSQTYPTGERDPSLMGQSTIQSWARCGQLNCREYELYTCALEYGLRYGYKNNGDGKDLEN